MRVYFYNPNNDSGQDWGVDPLERGDLERVPAEEINRTIGYIQRSWGADRLPAGELQASPEFGGNHGRNLA